MLEYLQAQVYPKQVAIPSYKMIRTEERCLDVKNLDTSSWKEITNQELWGGHREYYWFEKSYLLSTVLCCCVFCCSVFTVIL